MNPLSLISSLSSALYFGQKRTIGNSNQVVSAERISTQTQSTVQAVPLCPIHRLVLISSRLDLFHHRVASTVRLSQRCIVTLACLAFPLYSVVQLRHGQIQIQLLSGRIFEPLSLLFTFLLFAQQTVITFYHIIAYYFLTVSCSATIRIPLWIPQDERARRPSLILATPLALHLLPTRVILLPRPNLPFDKKTQA